MKTVKITNDSDIHWKLEQLNNTIEESNKYFKLIGKKQFKLSEKLLNQISEHLNKRLARYNELNTPEMLVKKAADKAKKELAKEKKEREKLEVTIKTFRDGGHIMTNVLRNNLKFDILRIDNDEIVTSGGARVKLSSAKLMLMALKTGANIIGKKIDNFTVNSIVKFDTDMVVTIGCHKILMSEIEKVLG